MVARATAKIFFVIWFLPPGSVTRPFQGRGVRTVLPVWAPKEPIATGAQRKRAGVAPAVRIPREAADLPLHARAREADRPSARRRATPSARPEAVAAATVQGRRRGFPAPW